MIKTNSASRVLSLLTQAQKYQGNEKVFRVWAGVFDINESDQNRKNMEVTRCLSLLHDEIDNIRDELNFDVSDEFNCSALLDSIFPILAVHLLMGDWSGLKPKLTRELFLCLGYCREVLPDEEDTINIEDIEELNELILNLKSQLESSTLPIHTKKIIQNHIDGVLKALHSYKILGVSSLQSAMNSIVGEVVANDVAFKDAKDTKEVSTLGKIIEKMHSVTDGVVKTEKLLASGAKIANHGEKMIEVVNELFKNA